MRVLNIVAACVVAVLAAGCSKDPEVAKREFAASGDAYVAQKKYAEAVIEYRNAIQQDPKFGEARFKLAETYMQLNQSREAAREYVRAADLMPDNTEAQVKAGRILLLAGQFQDAQARADAVLSRNPKHVDAQLLRAGALARMRNLDEAVTQIESAIEEDPARSGTYIDLGTLQSARGKVEEAEAAFKHAVEADPKSMNARVALANFYWLNKRAPAAEAALKEALALDPKNAQVNRTLAAFYLGSGRPAEAESFLKTLAEISKDDHSKVGLAMYYVGMKRRAEGERLLQQVAGGNGEPAASAKTRLAMLAIADGQRTEAYRLIDEGLQKKSDYALGHLTKAQLLLEDRKTDQALEAVKAVNGAEATKQLLLGRIYMARSDASAAEAALNEALRLNPTSLRAQLDMAKLRLATRNPDEALQLAQAVLKAQPRSGEAQLLLSRAYMAKGELQNAEIAMRPLIPAAVKSATVQSQFGLLYMRKKDYRQARAAFERALVLDSRHQEAIGGLAALDLGEGKTEAARERIARAAADSPTDPSTLMLAARGYTAMRDFASAEKTLREVIQLDPSLLSAYSMLGQVYTFQKRLDAARGEFEELARKSPKSVAPPTFVAMIYEAQNKKADAKSWYEKTLAIDKNAPVAANNLAYIIAEETDGNLDVALQLAQTAKAGLPDSAEVDDTLGWVYYKKGLATLAIRSFTESIEKDPKNATYHYHLGLAYINNREPDRARASLQEALSLKPSSDEAAAVQKALASLKS